MTLSLPATTAPVRPAKLPDQAPADALQAEPRDLFSDTLSVLEQDAAPDADGIMEGQSNEKPTKDAADVDSHSALPGMSQPILPMMLAMPAALGVPVQTVQMPSHVETENATPADVPSIALLGKDLIPGKVVERTNVETNKLDAGKEPISGEATEKIDVETDKPDVLLRAAPDKLATPRAVSGNVVIQEPNVMTRASRIDVAVTEQVSRPASVPAAVSTGDVPETKQQTAVIGATSGAPVAVQVAEVASPSIQTSTVKLAAEPAQSGQQLLHALGDRIQFQVEKHSEHATIRLDPPMMGRIEITVRHEGGALQVQLSATNTEVLRQLQDIGDHLRQDLVQRHYTDVSVSVSDHARDGRQQHQQEQSDRERRHAGRALAEAGQEGAAFALASDND